MKGLDFKHFKKVHSSHSHTVMQHPDGHMIHLQHSSLPKEHLADLKKLPFEKVQHLADGGTIRDASPEGLKRQEEGRKKVGDRPGRLKQGNIDLAHRPVVNNPDGSISTVRSMSFNEKGREHLIPTVSPEGKILQDQQAIDLYHKTGQHLGQFATPEDATKYAQQLHSSQEQMYSAQRGPQQGLMGNYFEGKQQLAPGVSITPEQQQAQNDLPPNPAFPLPGQSPVQRELASTEPNPADQLPSQVEATAKALKKAGEAEAAAATDKQTEFDLATDELADLDAQHQEAVDKIGKQSAVLQDAIRTGKVDANHYLQDMSTGSRISTGIGLLLGGMGAFATGGKNMAQEFLNKQIEQDIKAQEKNIDTKNTLLKYNLDTLKDHAAAINATRAQMYGALATRIEMAAQTAKGEQAKQIGIAAANEFKVKENDALQKSAMQSVLRKKVQSGEANLEQQISANPNIPEQRKEKALKDVDSLRGTEEGLKTAATAFKDAKGISSIDASNPLSEGYTKLKVANAKIIGLARSSMTGQGALSDQEVKDAIAPYLIDKFDKVGQIDIKEAGFKKWLEGQKKKHLAALNSIGLKLEDKPERNITSNKKIMK